MMKIAFWLLILAAGLSALPIWFWWEMREASRINLVVQNRATADADVAVFDTMRNRTALQLRGIAPGAREIATTFPGGTVPFVLRVRVGQRRFEMIDEWVLIDDNGPHTLEIEVFDDHVTINHGRYGSPPAGNPEMVPPVSATTTSAVKASP